MKEKKRHVKGTLKEAKQKAKSEECHGRRKREHFCTGDACPLGEMTQDSPSHRRSEKRALDLKAGHSVPCTETIHLSQPSSLRSCSEAGIIPLAPGQLPAGQEVLKGC